MIYLSKHTDRMDIHIEEYRHTILIQQRWKYNWLRKGLISSWTSREKRDFHQAADMLIWLEWGNRFELCVQGNSAFAIRNQGKTFKINFDIQWVMDDEHWKVNVYKIPKGTFHQSHVQWNNRNIQVDSEDVFNRNALGKSNDASQNSIVRQFGHSLVGNKTAASMTKTIQKNTTDIHYANNDSILDLGQKERERHLDFVLTELNTMISGTTFHCKL